MDMIGRNLVPENPCYLDKDEPLIYEHEVHIPKNSKEVTPRLLAGLSNYLVDKVEYLLDQNSRIKILT